MGVLARHRNQPPSQSQCRARSQQATLHAEYVTKRTLPSRPIGPESRWTAPEDATYAPVAAPLCSFAATAIAATATALCSVPTVPAAVQFVPPAAGIKAACVVVTPTPNGNAFTGLDSRK